MGWCLLIEPADLAPEFDSTDQAQVDALLYEAVGRLSSGTMCLRAVIIYETMDDDGERVLGWSNTKSAGKPWDIEALLGGVLTCSRAEVGPPEDGK